MRAEACMRAEQRAGAGACAARRGASGLVMSSGGAAPTQAVVSLLISIPADLTWSDSLISITADLIQTSSLGARLLTTRVARRLGLRQQGERAGEAVEGAWEMCGRYGEM